IPNVVDVSFHDLLELVYGRISLDAGKTYLTAAEVKRKLVPAFANRSAGFTEPQRADLASVRDRLRKLHDLVLRLVRLAQAGAAGPPGSDPYTKLKPGSDPDIELKLGDWIRGALVDCAHATFPATCADAGHPAKGWPGYPG